MIQLQILSKVIKDKNYDIIEKNAFDKSFFPNYEDVYDFITSHNLKYKSIPDLITVMNKFPDITFPEVAESEKYLIDALREEKQFSLLGPILNDVANAAKEGNSIKATELLLSKIPILTKGFNITGDNLIFSDKRFKELIEKQKGEKDFFISTGFPEIDEIILGLKRKEELLTIAARTNQGKSWILLKMLLAGWLQGETVGLYSGEMSADSIGYRFDTLYNHISNYSLYKGSAKAEQYKEYLDKLRKSKNSFIVITQEDLGDKATVSNIQAFIKSNNITMCGIDQYSLMLDERRQRGQDRRIDFTHICEDLFNLSKRLHVPIIGASQLNREAEEAEGIPDLRHMSESDGVIQNSSKIIMMRQVDDKLKLAIRKNRDGKKIDNLVYSWDIDKGEFIFIPTDNTVTGTKEISKQRRKFKEDKEVNPF